MATVQPEFGLDPKIIELLREVFRRHTRVQGAMLYGSRAKGNFKAGSDIDLTLTGSGLTVKDLLTIQEEIEDLSLPYKVDLSLFHQIENPGLVEHIERIGIRLYSAAS